MLGSSKPADSYTQAQSQSVLPEVGVDWVSWTTKPEQGGLRVDQVADLVGIPLSDWQYGTGALNYQVGMRRGPFTILTDGTQEGMGVHLRMSGDACRDLRGRQGFEWSDWLGERQEQGDFSRLDVCFDVKAPAQFPLETFEADVEHGNLVTRWKEFGIDRRYTFDGDSVAVASRIVRFGSRSSRSYCRVYDKGAQMGTNEHWTRIELETKGERCRPLVDRVRKSGLRSVAGVLYGLLDIKQPGTGERKHWRTASYWLDFLAGAEKARLTVDKPEQTAGTMAAWVERQVGPTLAMLYKHPAYGSAFVEQVANLAATRMKGKHRDILEAC